MLANPLNILGGAEGDRTPDPKTASLVLSQLSYSPKMSRNKEINLTSQPNVVKKKEGSMINALNRICRGHKSGPAFERASRSCDHLRPVMHIGRQAHSDRVEYSHG